MTPRAWRPASLPGWLAYLETLHPKPIAMGLERVRGVLDRMQLSLPRPAIVVTGTNGKGSTCALLDSMLRCAGFAVGLYTSPHLLRYNERVVVDGHPVDDDALVEAFDRVEDARTAIDPATPLTYFEFGTLAAFAIFAQARLDALVLEVGLGGRLDAVNAVDADVAVVTAIDVDHVDYLGPTREDIGREKAGVFRSGRPAICGDPRPPQALVEHASGIGTALLVAGRDFGAVAQGTQWRYFGPGGPLHGLPHPALRGAYQLDNAAAAIAALGVLRDRLPVTAGAVRDGLLHVTLPGRFMVLPGRPTIVLDVAHNPHAARALAATLASMGFHPRTLAVVGMLADKDVAGVIEAVRPRVDRWYCATLPGPRGASAQALAARIEAAGVPAKAVRTFDDVEVSYVAAASDAGEADRIVVFGSFLTVAAALGHGRPAAASSSA
jgi:dihydrofolate synthase/folylpolyglutamate synthase